MGETTRTERECRGEHAARPLRWLVERGWNDRLPYRVSSSRGSRVRQDKRRDKTGLAWENRKHGVRWGAGYLI